MKSHNKISLCLIILLVAAGCASTKVAERERLVAEQMPRPGNILVYNFVAAPIDVPADSVLAGQFSEQPTPQSMDEIESGRRIGAEIASNLVGQIRSMGLPAVQASNLAGARPNDIVIRGYLLSMEEGNAPKRFFIGFGSGASELKVAVEGFQVTPRGLRKIGSGTVSSSGNKLPGTTTSLGIALATGNPIGLIASTGARLYGEKSGRSTVEGRADQIAKEIAEQLKRRFQEQGWI